MDERHLALAMFLGSNPEAINNDYQKYYTFNDHEYLVLTDAEADELAEEYCREYLDEALDVPDNLRSYIDYEKYAIDVIEIDGRGHVLSSYDGVEYEVCLREGNSLSDAAAVWLDDNDLPTDDLVPFFAWLEEEGIFLDSTWYYIYQVN